MGSINSKSTNDNNYSKKLHSKNRNQFSSFSRPRSFSASCIHRNNSNDNQYFDNKRRSCVKRKVLILGLDGVGKTDLFTRLISQDKQKLKMNSLPQPTIGYNVQTIRVHCPHLCHRQYHEITLWDCGGESSARTLWPYHYSNTSLLLWLINIHDRSRLDTNLHLLSQILTNRLLYQVPVLIILYNLSFQKSEQGKSDNDTKRNLLTNLEVAFRFLATLSTSRASTFKWQVINVTLDDNNVQTDLKKIRECFIELMEL